MESIHGIFERQKIDCNCNDCFFMVRDIQKHEKSVKTHYKWQIECFNTIKNKMLEKAKMWEDKGEAKKSKALLSEANKMRFQHDKSTAIINFGDCRKLNKPVRFIPNTCQLHTQDCFKHRKS